METTTTCRISFSVFLRILSISFITVIIPLCSCAQFGPINYVFHSEAKYPFSIFSGDVDMDGDIDVIMHDFYPDGLFLFRNSGGGIFADREMILLSTNIIGANDRPLLTDLDTDGDADLVNNSTWYRNNGPGVMFTAMGTFAPSGTSASRLFSDFDADGDIDYIGRTATEAALFLNDGAGTFTMGSFIGSTGSSSTISADLGDLNGDLIDDIIIGGNNSQTGWYPGLGGGSFGSLQLIDQFLSPSFPVIGDMDGDGDKDLIAFHSVPGVRWWSNDGSGGFTLEDTLMADATLQDVIADIDGDNDMDISLGTGTSCNVIILKNDSGNTFPSYNVESFSGYNLVGTSYGTGDIDGDGDNDLLTAHGLGMAAWYSNDGNGIIGARKSIGRVLSGGREITTADIDLDGDKDFAVASYYGDFISLYKSVGFGLFSKQQLLAEHLNGVSKVRFTHLNNDNYPDLITNHPACAILWNNAGSWSCDTLPGQVVVNQAMDADGDFDIDLISNGKWLQNSGSGSFTVITEPDIPSSSEMDTADMNGDMITDLVLVDGGSIVVLINDGAGDFTPIVSSAAAVQIGIADIDLDGDMDVVSLDAGVQLYIYLNDGSGNLTGTLQYDHPVGVGNNLLVSDLDGDGYADAIWSHSNGYQHEVYVNRNDGTGSMVNAELIDPTAEVTYGLLMTDVNNDAVEDLICSRFHSVTWRENFYHDSYRMRGSVFKDFNIDAVLDSNEQKVPFQLVRSSANNILVWTNSAGNFDLPADTGNFNVWTRPPAIYQVTNNPDTLNATLTVLQPIQEDLNFGMAPFAEDSSALLTLTTTDDFQMCHTSAGLWIQVKNTGTFIPQNVIVDAYIHPDLAVGFTSIAPDSVSGDHYYWHIDSLGWFQQWTAYVVFINGPLGSSNNIDVTVSWANNSITESTGGQVPCAYDPNDKLVTPAGYGLYGGVDITTDRLEYTIRFQNTGTAPATNVVLRDTLDADLDWTSLDIVASSHPLTGIMVDEAGLATFRFDQIMLPDSNANEPASHGFVKFSLAPGAGIAHETQITNTAAIYFDYNEPVVTNSVLNTFIDCNLFSAQIALNGIDSITATAGDVYQWFMNGDSVAGGTNQWHIAGATGYYYAAVTSMYGCISVTDSIEVIVTSLEETDSEKITIRPNPSNGNFIVQCNCDQIELIDLSGRILERYAGSKTQWNVSATRLNSGLYIIRALKEGEIKGVRKVIIE